MDGILNIYKPSGPTSFDVVAIVKRLSGEKRVGHAGTLDPTASGVLPVCLGQATRVVEYLMDARKVYRAVITLGVTTDSQDAAGEVVLVRDPSALTIRNIEAVLKKFTGDVMQMPPMFSALKHKGQPLYKLARAGIEIERKSRPATIYRIDLLNCEIPEMTLEVECSKGTYIRTLAFDIGEVLGCGAHLKELVRLKTGIFDIKEAISLAEVEQAFRHGYWVGLLYPADAVLAAWPAIILDEESANKIRQGTSIELPVPQNGSPEYCRAYGLDGILIGLLRFDAETAVWHPEKVFA